MAFLSRVPRCLFGVLFLWPIIFPSINCRFPSMHQSSVSQRPGHGPLCLVPESLQKPLSHQLGEFPQTGLGSNEDPPVDLLEKSVQKLHHVRIYSQISTFFGLFSLHLRQVQKWDEQLEAGSFPGKIWATFCSVVTFVMWSVSSLSDVMTEPFYDVK